MSWRNNGLSGAKVYNINIFHHFTYKIHTLNFKFRGYILKCILSQHSHCSLDSVSLSSKIKMIRHQKPRDIILVIASLLFRQVQSGNSVMCPGINGTLDVMRSRGCCKIECPSETHLKLNFYEIPCTQLVSQFPKRFIFSQSMAVILLRFRNFRIIRQLRYRLVSNIRRVL